MYNFEGKSVIVTGSSSGIGRATAIEFAKYKARVLLTGRNEEALLEAVAECEKFTGKENVCYIIGDVCNEDTLQSIVKMASDQFGGIDILVNNAATALIEDIEMINMENYDRIFNTNIRAVFRITQLAIPYLQKSKGNIINVSSISGSRFFYAMTTYCMTKAALNMFTNALALELAPYGIRANTVSPGGIYTKISVRIGHHPNKVDKHMENLARLHPLGRCAESTEIAHVIVFLASDRASFMTGSNLHVDGGLCTTASWFQPSVGDKTEKKFFNVFDEHYKPY